MIIAIVFASLWSVMQLTVLGSMARTVRVRTVITALLVGLYACALLAVLLQAAFSRPAAWLSGMNYFLFRDMATHSVDPFIRRHWLRLAEDLYRHRNARLDEGKCHEGSRPQ